MKDIPGYEGLYAITEDGRVWSYRKNRWVKSSANKKGYVGIGLYDTERK